ncbi:hypothetical protein TcCL_NonESM05923 [Trypanosoma cruzi]|nr:hypothetical protein TcCL_NonESM05923 [Trypanosoma cruzi]
MNHPALPRRPKQPATDGSSGNLMALHLHAVQRSPSIRRRAPQLELGATHPCPESQISPHFPPVACNLTHVSSCSSNLSKQKCMALNGNSGDHHTPLTLSMQGPAKRCGACKKTASKIAINPVVPS